MGKRNVCPWHKQNCLTVRRQNKKKACDRIRTGDPFLTKEVLYLLSYTSILKKAGDEVRTRDP